MIKKILISLTLITIIGCCWFFFTLFDAIDLAPTKNNHLASEEKWKIEQRADIDSCEKHLLKNQIDLRRGNAKRVSELAFRTQTILFFVICIQIVILLILLIVPKRYIFKI
ncbi:hypothetical protein ACLCDV_10015 [Sphingobacterium sp. Lzh-3]|uniref:hypothetical protein n=1 Tax=unclassified Sphingobacterium TaxID=2609468 RepID=UPI002953D3A7|nr:hypothetical protein [Sphingobacterium sp. UGAL515B_05]WON94295.1 hypothetical protein OK025_24000 [Sphingobacterium sp. UGAL515B_05]